MNSLKYSFYTISLLLGLSSCTSEPASVPIQGRIKKETLSVSGKIPGRIEAVYVSEGDLVQAGDTLAKLSIPEVDAKIAQAQGAVQSAEAQYQMAQKGATALQLEQLNAKYAGLKEQYSFAQASVKRLKNMLIDSLVSQQQYDEAYAKMQGAKAQLDATVAQIKEAKDGARSEQQTMALGQKKRATGALQEAGAASVERYITAPQDMTIETVTLHKGELALPGYTLFTGYINDNTYFRFTLPESKIKGIKVGQQVIVRIPYKEQKIKGSIVNVSQLNRYADITTAYPEYEMDEAVYEIKVRPAKEADASSFFNNAKVVLEL